MTDAGEQKKRLDSHATDAVAAKTKAKKKKKKDWQRKSDMVDDWGDKSFPASDPPGHY